MGEEDEENSPIPGFEVSSAGMLEATSLSEMTVTSDVTESESSAPGAAILRRRRETPPSDRPGQLAMLERVLVQLAALGGQVEAIQWRDEDGNLQITEVHHGS